jgi:hypothetical protein
MAKDRKKIKDELLQSVVDKIASFDKPKIETFMPCEWVIQFDNDEPQLFTSSDEFSESPEVVIRIQNTNEGFIKFTDSVTGKTFKLFARPKK